MGEIGKDSGLAVAGRYPVDQGGNTRVAFRGAIASMGTETSPLVLYIDGVPVDTFSFLDATLLDIERIEVLRGAQSAMYGKNAFAGVVNVISKKPGNTSTGKVFMDGGTEYGYAFGASATAPVIEDKLFFSLSGAQDYRDGYMDLKDSSESNHDRNVRFKGQLRFLPTDHSQLRLHMGYTQVREGPKGAAAGIDPILDSPANDADYRDLDILNMALHGSLDLSAMTLQSITTFRRDMMTAALDVSPYLVTGVESFW